VLLDTDGFWDPLVAQLDRMVTAGLLSTVNRALVQRARSPQAALDLVQAVPPAPAEKWITPGER
jgi:predicted Rossmann-fold nucleotide-binding protein